MVLVKPKVQCLFLDSPDYSGNQKISSLEIFYCSGKRENGLLKKQRPFASKKNYKYRYVVRKSEEIECISLCYLSKKLVECSTFFSDKGLLRLQRV